MILIPETSSSKTITMNQAMGCGAGFGGQSWLPQLLSAPPGSHFSNLFKYTISSAGHIFLISHYSNTPWIGQFSLRKVQCILRYQFGHHASRKPFGSPKSSSCWEDYSFLGTAASAFHWTSCFPCVSRLRPAPWTISLERPEFWALRSWVCQRWLSSCRMSKSVNEWTTKGKRLESLRPK